jgi:WD repeat-containing protein 22
MLNTVKHLIDSQFHARLNTHSKFNQKRFDYAWNLFSKDLKSHFGCVTALEFSNRDAEHFASGGDDRRILVWSINNDLLTDRKCEPVSMKSEHNSNIFTIAWDNENRRLFSGGNDHQVIVHDVKTYVHLFI